MVNSGRLSALALWGFCALSLGASLSLTWLEWRAQRCASASMTLARQPISQLQVYNQRCERLSLGAAPQLTLNQWAHERGLRFESASCPLLQGPLQRLTLSSAQTGERLVLSESSADPCQPP